jgi:predicted O-methyltransferase YrrM
MPRNERLRVIVRYRSTACIPPLVERATVLASEFQFGHSCWPEVGRLLSVVASHIQDGVIGEVGTGCGVGTAWMVSALSPSARLVTIELDATRAEAAQNLFAPYPNVQVLQGDWHELLSHGPFDLLFVDGGSAKREEPEIVLDALRPGGLVVLDDLWPEGNEPLESRGKADSVRDYWLNTRRLAATEVLTSPAMAVILATRMTEPD